MTDTVPSGSDNRRLYAVAGICALFLLSLLALAVYVSSSAAVPMFVLSGKYAAATTGPERLVILAAAEAVIARGEDSTPGSFIGSFQCCPK